MAETKSEKSVIWRIGEILVAKEDVKEQTRNGSFDVLPKGSRSIVGFDKRLHHYNGRISLFDDDVEIAGYTGGGISEYIYDMLAKKLPLEDMLSDYEVSKENFIDELIFILDEIGLPE